MMIRTSVAMVLLISFPVASSSPMGRATVRKRPVCTATELEIILRGTYKASSELDYIYIEREQRVQNSIQVLFLCRSTDTSVL